MKDLFKCGFISRNNPSYPGYNQIHIAVHNSKPNIVRLLHKCEIGINKRSIQGFTPLAMATDLVDLQTTKTLIQCGEKLHEINRNHSSATISQISKNFYQNQDP